MVLLYKEEYRARETEMAEHSNPQVQRVSWKVPSDSKPGAHHFVTADFRCSCEAGRYGKTCKHAAAVAEMVAEATEDK